MYQHGSSMKAFRKESETYSVRNHRGEHRPVRIICIEFPYQYRHHRDLNSENDGMEQWLQKRCTRVSMCSSVFLSPSESTASFAFTCHVHIFPICNDY